MTEISCPNCANVIRIFVEEDLCARWLTCFRCQTLVKNPSAGPTETSITELAPPPSNKAMLTDQWGPSIQKNGWWRLAKLLAIGLLRLMPIALVLAICFGPWSPFDSIRYYWLWQRASARVQNGMTLAQVEGILGPGKKGPPPFFCDVNGSVIYLWGDPSLPAQGRQIRIGFQNGAVCDMRCSPGR